MVVGANSDSILDTVDYGGTQITINKDWEKGLSSSVKSGLASC